MLVIVSITDIREYRIPNNILFIFGIIRSGIWLYELSKKVVVVDEIFRTSVAVLAILICGVLLKLISHGGIGMGDVKLLIYVTMYMGYHIGIDIIYISILIMGVIDAILIVLKVKSKKDVMPFAPAVLLGTLGRIMVL